MAVKFSEFATGASTGTTTKLVGFDGVAGSQTNKQFSLSLTGIYSTNGVLLANRTVTMNNKVLTFVGGPLNLIPAQSGTALEIKNNPVTPGTPVSMFKIDESGLFQIGKSVLAKVVGDVAIGKDIDITSGQQTIASPAIAIGLGASSIRPDSIAIGSDTRALTKAVSIGYRAGLSGTGTNAINIGVNTKAGINAINIGIAGSGLGASGQDSIAMGNAADSDGIASIAIGLGATSKALNQISIGSSAGATQVNTTNAGNIYIGNGADTKSLKADNKKIVCIGELAQVGGINSVVIGYGAGAVGTAGYVTYIGEGSGSVANNALATNSVAIGRSSKVGGAGAISIGYSSQSTLANSITLNASGVFAENAVIKSFKVFMTDGTTPDFDVVAGGESTLNTSLKITGQAYTELNAQASSNLTFNWNDGNIQSTTGLTGSPTFTASNPKAGATYIITLAQDEPVTATWTGVKWPGGTAPTLSGANKTDVITLICYDAAGAGLYYGAATLDLS